VQLHLLTDEAPPVRTTTPHTDGDRHVTETTVPVPVLYRCRLCERETQTRTIWRSTHQRRMVHTSFWNPSVRTQVDLYAVTWTTADGRTAIGQEPPHEHCPRCKRTTFGTAIRGRYSARVTCNAKCIYATGHDCECSCAGANHGAGHSR
jgi:hypothetical protein